MSDDIKARLRDPEMSSHESQSYVVWTIDDDCLLDDAADRIAQLERELADARKDADRYRWWKNFFDTIDGEMPGRIVEARNSTELDAAIDEAIVKDKQ